MKRSNLASRGPSSASKALLAAVLTLTFAAGGCQVVPWLAHGVGGGDKKVDVKAEYRGLDNRTVAVMVMADETTLFGYPQAPGTVTRAVSSHLAQGVPGVTVMDPNQIIAYQRANPYWTTYRHGELARAMGVDRLVLIDLVEYRTHEPGNAHVWQGVTSGNIVVIESDAEDPDNPAYTNTVRVQFPEDTKVGVVNADSDKIQLGMVKLFSQRAAGLFYDHEVTQ